MILVHAAVERNIKIAVEEMLVIKRGCLYMLMELEESLSKIKSIRTSLIQVKESL